MDVREPSRWFVIGFGVFVLAILGSGGYFFFKSRQPAAPPPPPPVAEAPRGPESGDEIVLNGELQARNIVPVPPPVDGIVEGLDIDPGMEVAEGQVLARIRNEGLEQQRRNAEEEVTRLRDKVLGFESSLTAARLEASRAQADASRVQSEFDRLDKLSQRDQMLYREGAIPRLRFEKSMKDFEAVKAERDTLAAVAEQSQSRVSAINNDLDLARKILEDKNAELDEAKTDAEAAVVEAPASGVVLAIKAKIGDEVDGSLEDFIQIAVDPAQLKVILNPEPPVAEKLTDGLDASVQVAEFPGESLPGVVRRGEEGAVWVEFSSPSPVIRPGLTASVRLKLP